MNTQRVWTWIKDKYVYVITLGIALIMMIGAWYIGEIGPFGDRCLVVVDGVHQYLPFFSEYQEKLKNFESLQYSFDVGLGNNFVSLWSYYLSSPFNLIVMLCSKRHLPMALNIIISVKIILAALCFAYFLMHAGKRPEKNPGIIAFSLFYAFSSFVVGYYWNLMWLDSIFIFPIIILGMEKMFTENNSRIYILALFYSMVCNYYISFIICLFLVLWFFTFPFHDLKSFVMRGMRFAVASLTAAMLGAVVLIPAYLGIMTTASAEFGLPEWKFYGSFADTLRSQLFCSEVMTNQVGDGGTNLYCGIFTVLLAFMFFFVWDVALAKKIKYGILLVLLVVSFNNQLLNYIWHGFHNQYGIPNRFAFLYIFILLIMAYEVYLKRDRLRMWMVVIAYTISMLFVVFCYYNAEVVYENETYIVTGVLLTVYLVLFVLYCKWDRGKKGICYALVVMAVFEMAVNGWFGFKEVGSSDPVYYYGGTDTFEALKDKVEEGETNWCRSDILEPLLVDEATWYNLKSVGIFGSTVRGELVDVMNDLGFYTGANEYLYYGSTPFTNALLGVKYVYTREGDFVNVDMQHFSSEGNVSVYRNSYVLPIGYMVKKDILLFDTEDNGPFTVQNELSGALTGIEPIFTSIQQDMQPEAYGTNMDVTLRDSHNIDYKNANGSARADMVYTVPCDMDLYVSCQGSNVNKIALLIGGNEVAYDRYQSQLFHVGEVTAGQTVDIQFILNDGDDMSGNLYCYPMKYEKEQFLAAYDILNSQSMTVTDYSSRKIEGTVLAKEDGVFMTSIPYDEGWTMYANGQKVRTQPILTGFLGAELPAGEYDIKMVYRCPGLLEGCLITLMGILSFWLIGKIEKKSQKREGNTYGEK
ncbi:MAG: YfhO family protein [Lachnospiraceae bacterium]|nr:YfhO family protein [Lachnospiraceae bacterium]